MVRPDFDDPMEWVAYYWRNQQLGDSRMFVAMGSVLRLHQLMTTEVERVLKHFGLNLTGYLVLATVQLSEDGSRLLSRIATHMMVHQTTVTLVVEKLEEQRLIVREPHPTDRRATHAKITPAGTALMKEATRALKTVHFGLPGLTRSQAEQVTAVLAPIRRAAGDIDTVHTSEGGKPHSSPAS